MKKEEITVKLTNNNLQKVLKTLKKSEQEYCVFHSITIFKNNTFEKLYLFYSADSNLWITSETKPKDKTLIKPKQLKELLENEPPYTSKYWDNPLWEMTKGGVGDKGEKYIPENKTLEVGKWYKYQGFDHKGNDRQIMFLFNGIKGNEGKTIWFNEKGEYRDDLSVFDTSSETYTEAKPEEVIQSFVYHMETFANKRKNIKTAELRDILNQFHREEISFSKVVELVNKGGK